MSQILKFLGITLALLFFFACILDGAFGLMIYVLLTAAVYKTAFKGVDASFRDS